MIYIIGLILSFIYCGQILSSEIQSRNTFHMKNGDKPNAFVTIFPAIPFFQIIFLIICWLLNYFFHPIAIKVLCILFIFQFIFWVINFKRNQKKE
ncbi:hypothetical protein F900_00095 [Acinetobacter modestus]|uniref:Uncharacterized protein n=1 Tax=Acinetobacter modestus TaxID=1776740 RepID=N9M7L2_9GAMM|nr:hypothetical protein F900_00095 [Acinetobacter modestus]